MIEPRQQLDRIERETERLLRTATDLKARVPSCPGWTVADLLGHVGGVHRWAATVVEERRTEARWDWAKPPAEVAELGTWVQDGAHRLVDVLGATDPAVAVWGWAGDGTAAFWFRRMACETLVHRIDTELAAGGAPGPVEPDAAVDGIDELLVTLLGNSVFGLKLAGAGETLHLHASDADGGEWTITFAPEGLSVDPGHAKADAALAGPASDLLRWVWRRGGTAHLAVHGEPDVLQTWWSQFPL